MRRRLVWVTVLLVIVSLPLVLFALIGLPHFFRGPLVRNVIAREAGGEPPAVASATRLLIERANAGPCETLIAGGVRVYEYRPATMHAKTLVVDGAWSVVSTMNFDNRSLAYYNEVALVAMDSAVGPTVEALFLDDLCVSEEIRLETFRQRSRTQRLLERAASVLAKLPRTL